MASNDRDDKVRGSLPFGMPSLDFSELMKPFQLPGIDMEGLLASERKNIEALREANQAVVEGWQALAAQQQEILAQTMNRWRELADEGLPSSPQEAMEKQAEVARDAFEQALENMRTLAEISAKSQAKAFEAIRKRIDEASS